MSSCLSHRFVFGVQGCRSNAIAFSDQATIVYVAGHNIVIYNILEGKQRFIHGSDLSVSITAMTVCPSARFVALAEDGDKPTVSEGVKEWVAGESHSGPCFVRIQAWVKSSRSSNPLHVFAIHCFREIGVKGFVV